MSTEIFHFKEPILPFRKHYISCENGVPLVLIKPKISFFPKYYFYKSDNDNTLLYYGILKNTKKIVNMEFVIYTPDEQKVVTVRNKPLVEMTQMFREFNIFFRDEKYEVKFSAALKNFTIYNSEKEIVVVGERVSSFFSQVLERRKFRVSIEMETDVDTFLWTAIVKSMFELM